MGKAQCDNCKSITFYVMMENGILKSLECSNCRVIINVSTVPKDTEIDK
jgi:hypothetical protein